ncbi:metal-dependent transcriptional regulator [Desulfobacterota bacterium M19]
MDGLSASQEDYLEVIFHLSRNKRQARAKDIAQALKVSRASVTEALRGLSKRKLINYAPYEAISLTARGQRAALDVVQRHQALKNFFIRILAVDEDLADRSACRVEHAAPPEIIKRLTALGLFLESREEKLLAEFIKSL